MSGNPQALILEQPLQIDEARRACQTVAEHRRMARGNLERALNLLAERERDYRQARAVAYVNHAQAPSAGARDAKVDSETSHVRYERDLAKGIVTAAEERLKEIDGERASLHRLVDWSMRVDPYAVEDRSQNGVRAAA